MEQANTAKPVRPATRSDRRGAGRPDPRPARLMLGAGALAATTIMLAGLVDFPSADASSAPSSTEQARPTAQARRAAAKRVEPRVRYIRLKPGQAAPRGARVIQEDAPPPRVVVRRVATVTRSVTPQRVVRTRQSGRG
jgi:hypothetical protein